MAKTFKEFKEEYLEKKQQSAYKAGKKHALNNLLKKDNPHKKDSEDHHSWNRGYDFVKKVQADS